MSSLPSPVLVGSDYSSDYRFRVRYGDHIKHLLVKEGSLTGDEQCVPLFALPSLPYGEDTWNVAELSRGCYWRVADRLVASEAAWRSPTMMGRDG